MQQGTLKDPRPNLIFCRAFANSHFPEGQIQLPLSEYLALTTKQCSRYFHWHLFYSLLVNLSLTFTTLQLVVYSRSAVGPTVCHPDIGVLHKILHLR